MAGLTAEAVSAVSYLPTDIVAQRLQTHVRFSFIPERLQTRSAFSILRHVYATEGLARGLFRGYWAYLAVNGPGSAVWWACYEAGKRTIESAASRLKHVDDSQFTLFKAANYTVSGSVAGVVSCLVTNPLDVARTRLQLLEYADKAEQRTLKSGFIHLLKQVYAKEGVRGLYKGIKPRLWVRAPGSAVALVGYEYLKSASQRPTPAIAPKIDPSSQSHLL